MTQDEIDKMERLLHAAIDSFTKAEAKIPLNELRSKARQIRPDISSYADEKLSQAIGYAESASGRVESKEHWGKNAKQAWYLFEREIRYSED